METFKDRNNSLLNQLQTIKEEFNININIIGKSENLQFLDATQLMAVTPILNDLDDLAIEFLNKN